MSDSKNIGNGGEDAADRALREGLRAPSLSAEALQRIRAATEQEWRAVTQSPVEVRGPRRRWLAFAAAASVAILAGVVGWNIFMTDLVGGAVVGQLARFDAPGVVEARFVRGDTVLEQGASLHAGQSLDVRGDSLTTLAGGGNLRVARASAFKVVAANAVKLERGELYVDIPPGSRGSDRFMVVTPAGEFRHVGTQFAVAILNGATRLRVREGSVSWHATDGDSTVNAGTEVLIDRNRTVTRRPIATVGREWAWAESMAPEIDIENRPLREFLDWFARETGRKLELADSRVREQADGIRMHGNVRGLSAVEALTAVMASTTLRFELRDGVIRVSSARDFTTPHS
ncbi:MAG TPA: FecR domain-containing protein [Steroidobacteraceae bacterium]|nr:FecR domain-containing protein [Steroidobacteraceae bacterium]